MKSKGILAVGSVALDTVKTPFGKITRALGGSAVYFSAGARFFIPVSIVAVVGNDFPKKHLELLRRLGVNTAEIQKVREGKTFHWEGVYGYDLNNPKTLKTELNVFETFQPKLSALSRKSSFVFLANIDPDIQQKVLRQVDHPQLVACDTMNYWIKNKRASLLKLLRQVDVFLCNEAEARELSGEFNLLKASQWILSRGPKLLVIKKGEHGVICFSKTFVFTTPAYLLEKVFDPTGAGDAFAGGFLGHLARSRQLSPNTVRRAAIYGSVLASYNVESFSLGRLATLSYADIEHRVRHFREMTLFPASIR
jgi:sugar/nucleoside kinase (ribokinase family)